MTEGKTGNELALMGIAVDCLNFENPSSLANALADRVAVELSSAISERGRAVLIVSGGKTPITFFRFLSEADIDWKNVTISLADERYVPITSDFSNEKMVRENLLQSRAAKANFVGLYNKTLTSELAAFSAASRVDSLPKPFDVVILGMGEDGHTASFFPGGDRLKQAIDIHSRAMVLPLHAKGAGAPRLTMTLPLLVSGRFIAVHIEGQKKMAVFEKALQEGEDNILPIRAVLKHAAQPVQLYWAPLEEEKFASTSSIECEEQLKENE